MPMNTMLVSGRPNSSKPCLWMVTTWSKISCGSKLRMRFNLAVAQNAQFRLHPTWLLTQAVMRFSVGINTLSTTKSSWSFTAFFRVPSELRCTVASDCWGKAKSVSNRDRKALGRLVMSWKSNACLDHNHSYTWSPRKAGSPAAAIQVRRSSLVRDRMSRSSAIRVARFPGWPIRWIWNASHRAKHGRQTRQKPPDFLAAKTKPRTPRYR